MWSVHARSLAGSGSGDVDCKLIIASAADYLSHASVFSISDIIAGKDCEIPGQIQFSSCFHSHPLFSS